MYKFNFTNPWIFLTSSKLSMTAIASSNAALDRRQAFSWAHQGKLLQKFTHHLLLQMIVAIFILHQTKLVQHLSSSLLLVSLEKNIDNMVHLFTFHIQDLTFLLWSTWQVFFHLPVVVKWAFCWDGEFTWPKLKGWTGEFNPTFQDHSPETLVHLQRR